MLVGAQSLLGIAWGDVLPFWSKKAFIGTQKLPKFQFTYVAPYSGTVPF